MVFQADTLLQLVLLIIWNVLTDTRPSSKQPHFAKYIPTQATLELLASCVSLVFAPGLFEVMQAATPPTVQYFKTLPTLSDDDPIKRWAVYLLVLERAHCRTRIYIGSGTHASQGVRHRMGQYSKKVLLPAYVAKALEEGYSITHQGSLCWIDLPSVGLVLKIRLLFLALEAAFTYIFWAIRTVNSENDYYMGHICLWDRATLEYDGLCTHCCLGEAIFGNYELSERELEEHHDDKKRKIREVKTKDMRKRRALNPQKFRDQDRTRKTGIVKKKDFYCALCKISLDGDYALQKHNSSVKHLKKAEYLKKPHVCTLCSWGCDRLGHYNQHLTSVRHLKMKVEAEAEDKETSEEESSEDEASPKAAQSSYTLD